MATFDVNNNFLNDVKFNGVGVNAVRKNGVRIWPPDNNLITGQLSTTNMGWDFESHHDGNGGYTNWHTQIIPSSERTGKLAYVNRVDFRRGTRYASGDNFSMGHRIAMRTFYVTDASPFDDIELTDVQKHGYFDADNGFTYTVPEGRVIIGFQYRGYMFSGGGDDNLGSFEHREHVYVYTAKVTGVNRPYRLVHGSQSYNSDSDSSNDTVDHEWLDAVVYGNTLGSNHFLSGIHLNTNLYNNGSDDDVSIHKSVTIRNYYRGGTITY